MLNSIQCEVLFVSPNSANLSNFPGLFVEGPRYSVACASHADTETQRKILWLWTYNKKTPPFRLVETVSYPLPLQEH